jgi:hypothetical protein
VVLGAGCLVQGPFPTHLANSGVGKARAKQALALSGVDWADESEELACSGSRSRSRSRSRRDGEVQAGLDVQKDTPDTSLENENY